MKADKSQTTDAVKRTDAVLPGEKHVRQAVTAVSRDHRDDLLVKSDLMNDTFSMLKEENSTGVKEREEHRSKGQARLCAAVNCLLGLAAVGFLFCAWQQYYTIPALGVLLLFVLLRGGIAYLEYRRKQQAWINRMGWTVQHEKAHPGKLVLWVAAGIAGAALLVALVFGLAYFMRPAETPGPTTAGLDMEAFDFNRVILDCNPSGLQFVDDLNSVDIQYLVTEHRIYFIAGGTLYSVNADYSDAIEVDNTTGFCKKSGGVPGKEEAPVYSMLYADGSLYYVRHEWNGSRTTSSLMELKCGGKLKSSTCYKVGEVFDSFRFNADGSVDLFRYDKGWKQAVAGLDIGIDSIQADRILTPELLRRAG